MIFKRIIYIVLLLLNLFCMAKGIFIAYIGAFKLGAIIVMISALAVSMNHKNLMKTFQ